MKNTSRQPTRKTVIRSLIRQHVVKLNKFLHNKETPYDDFILYAVPDDNCNGNTVTLRVDSAFFVARETWVALMIQRNPYLISRKDCAELLCMDDTIQIDIHAIMNVPEEPIQQPITVTNPLNNRTSSLSVSTSAYGNSYLDRHSETLIRVMRRKHSIYIETPYKLFSLVRYIKEGGLSERTHQNDERMRVYLKLVIDYSLITANFSNPEHRLILENKLLTYYNSVVMNNNETAIHVEQPQLFFDFMLNAILKETTVVPISIDYFDVTSIRYQYRNQAKWPLSMQCIEWELFRLKRAKEPIDLQEFQLIVDEFLDLLKASPLNLPEPEWILYYMDKPNLMWREDGVKSVFIIRFEWLPYLNLSLPISERLHKGEIQLNTEEFHDYFLPCLYRFLLIDSFRFLWMARLTYRDDTFVESLNLVAYDNFINPLPMSNADARALLEYSKTTLSNLESPITKTLIKREALIPKRNTILSSTISVEEAALLSHEIDIEELNEYLPACLKPIMKKKVHLVNMDRVAAVSYLLDMGYEATDAPRLLNGNDKNEIVAQFKSRLKWSKNTEKRDPTKLVSLCCNAWFSIDGSRGNTIRCPYEKAANGDKRKPKGTLLDEEKRAYRTQCSVSLGPNAERISHPLDYVKYKLRDMS